MRIGLLINLLLVSLVLSCALPAQTRRNSLRPSEVISDASSYLNQIVDIEILEPLYGPSNPQELARVEYGQLEIRIPEGASGRLSLVPQTFKVNDPNRYRHKFDRVIESPVKVRGEFLKDEEMSKAERRPVYVIRVSSAEPVVLGEPEKVRSIKDIESDPARWDRKLILYEGVYKSGFEISSLEGIWLETSRNATIVKPTGWTADSRANRVRVTGILFSKPGAHYGHLGGSNFQLIASKIEYLGAVR
jgi:hypothetical protein